MAKTLSAEGEDDMNVSRKVIVSVGAALTADAVAVEAASRVRSARRVSFVVAVVAAVLMLPMVAGAANPKPSWRCIAGVCLGQSRAAVTYKHGVVTDDRPSLNIKVPGGKVWACYWRCQGAATEDGFTHYGGNMRPANQLLTVSTCDPILRLPDGVKVGMTIPFGRTWNGYKRAVLFEPGPRPGWQKTVTTEAGKVRIILDMTQGRVNCVYLERARAAGFFASVDRLQRCFLSDDSASCTSGPSGQGVSLTPGGRAVYKGITGSVDRGGPALAMGRSVTNASGTITCDSSSRGITCRDRTTGNSFVIGDRYVRVINGGQETRY